MDVQCAADTVRSYTKRYEKVSLTRRHSWHGYQLTNVPNTSAVRIFLGFTIFISM
jgi:hypothetical protein